MGKGDFCGRGKEVKTPPSDHPKCGVVLATGVAAEIQCDETRWIVLQG